jgi:methylphosphotriester-DNA--protein-cysteine methyltransferase
LNLRTFSHSTRLWLHFAMSARNLTRVLHGKTGATPADFVEMARIDATRRLLEESETPLRTSRCAGPASSAPGAADVFLPPFRAGTAHVVQFGLVCVE